tara:strand:+ start:3530 stop:3892 length:363 start_codon:yes stop_codon:yes gene_type:complete
MTWQTVLKVLTPRMFLENIRSVIGGEISGSSSRAGDRFFLDSNKGKITLSRKGSSPYNIRHSDFNINTHDLQKVLDSVLSKLIGETEKVAGAVTTGSPAHSHLFRPTFGGGKRAKDEEED